MSNVTPAPHPTDEPVEPWDEASDPDGYTRTEVTPKDWYLDTLLGFVVGDKDDTDDGAVGITVTTAGAVVSGIAISRKAYIGHSLELLRKSGTREDLVEAVETLWNLGATRAIDEANRRHEVDLPSRARRFIHMRDARIWAPEGSLNVPLWRGTLVDITGWSLGSHNDTGAASPNHNAED